MITFDINGRHAQFHRCSVYQRHDGIHWGEVRISTHGVNEPYHQMHLVCDALINALDLSRQWSKDTGELIDTAQENTQNA